jgi:septal ring factor EnvC (AmiA/AmiB activator)
MGCGPLLGLALAAVCSGFGAAGNSERSILGELERIDQACSQTRGALRQSQAQQAALEAQLLDLRQQQEALQRRLSSAQSRHRDRVRALSRLPSGLSVTALSQSRSLGEYLQAQRVLRLVAAHDLSLAAQLSADTQRLLSVEAAVRAQRGALTVALADTRGRLDLLQADRGRRQSLLRAVRQQKKHALALAVESRAAQRKLRDMVAAKDAGLPRRGPAQTAQRTPRAAAAVAQASPLQALATAKFSRARGRLAWPAQGPVRIAFGQRVELAFGTVTAHNGWDIAAPADAPVQALAQGTVAYAGWLRGYGQLVIVDHGDNYHSIAAHLGSVDVHVGEAVTQGQALGKVGDTGSLRGTVLYFELRHRGVPLDPRHWLKKRSG